MNEIIEMWKRAEQAILDHVGYVPTWEVLPLSDDRTVYWTFDREDRGVLVWSPDRSIIERSLAAPDDIYDPIYRDALMMHGTKGQAVFRGPEITLVAIDTRQDGNKFLRILSNDHEVK